MTESALDWVKIAKLAAQHRIRYSTNAGMESFLSEALSQSNPSPLPVDGIIDGAIPELLDRYWDLAYAEGKEARTHDNEAGDAQRTRYDLDRAVARLEAKIAAIQSGTVAQEPVVMMGQIFHDENGKRFLVGFEHSAQKEIERLNDELLCMSEALDSAIREAPQPAAQEPVAVKALRHEKAVDMALRYMGLAVDDHRRNGIKLGINAYLESIAGTLPGDAP